MKKIISTLFSIFFAFGLFAQQAPPQGINYQAMVYVPYGNQQVGVNSAGQIPANTKQVLVKFTLEEGNDGPVIYEETHIDTTDQYGLLNTVIGTGTPTSNSPGLFNQIDWSLGDPHLRVSITLTQYNSTVSSYQKLWSVPYALYADQANSSNYSTNSGHADSSDYASQAGNGITGVTDNGDGTLTFTYYDGSSYTTGPLTGIGSVGPQGPAGANGQSAYDLWLAQGNTGTVSDFLNSLQGTSGIQGPAGANGQSAYDLWLAQGNSGSQQDFLNSLQGATGPQGPAGATGLAGAAGAIGPQGPAGSAGVSGTNGTNGTNGQNTVVKTTTEVAGVNCATGGVKIEYGLDVNNNGTLDVGEVNSSLTKYVCNGAVGATGAQGPAGPTGATGPTGPQGIQGPAGTPGSQNAWSLTGNAGTNPTTNFIGTTDAQDWLIKTNNTERMRVSSAGNVGIGTSSPNSKVHISGTLNTESIGTSPYYFHKVTDNLGQNRMINQLNYDNSYSQIDISVLSPNGVGDASIRYFVNTNTTGQKYVSFFRGNALFDISAQIGVDGLNSYFQRHGGNFGIGTSIPLGKLHVNNDVSGSDSSFVVTTAGKVGIGTNVPNGHLTIRGGIGSSIDSSHLLLYNKYYTSGSPQLKFYSTNNLSTGSYGIQALKAGVGSGNLVLNESGGNVGIGTVTPAAKLDVNGSVKIVDGTQGAGKVLTSDANGNATWQSAGSGGAAFSNMQVYSTSGTFTFTVPAGVTKVMVEAWGAGGGGGGTNSGYGAGGGGGAYAKQIISVTAGNSYSVIVGAGGGGGAAGVVGGNGTSSSFGIGPLVSAGGGSGGQPTGIGGAGGTSTATFNISGEPGRYGYNNSDAFGGASPNGGHGGVHGVSSAGGVGSAPGGGGGGAGAAVGAYAGGAGAAGRIVIWY